MAGDTERPPIPVIKRDGFRLCRDRFSVAAGDIERLEGNVLRSLFLYHTGQIPFDDWARNLLRWQFPAGQLKHYGIEFPSKATFGDLCLQLRDAVKAGKCDHVPESIVALKGEMEDDYAPLYQKWERDVEAWEIQQDRLDEKEFKRCKSAGERARCDVNRFFEHYFLTNGLPDKLKTPEPLAISGIAVSRELFEVARQVPDLQIMRNANGTDVVACIGWDAAAVQGLLVQLGSKTREVRKALRQADWEASMRVHREFVSQIDSIGPSRVASKDSSKPNLQPCSLEECCGSYIVECEPFVKDCEEYRYIRGGFTFDIDMGEQGSLVVNFTFGNIEGTIIMSPSREMLEEVTVEKRESDGKDLQTESPSRPEISKPSHHQQTTKHKLETPEDKTATGTQAREGRSPEAKRRKLGPPVSRRFWYKIVARINGGIAPSDPEFGRLDFLDDRCTRFASVAYYFPFIERTIDFKGYKVSDTPKVKATDWLFISQFFKNCDTERRQRPGRHLSMATPL